MYPDIENDDFNDLITNKFSQFKIKDYSKKKL